MKHIQISIEANPEQQEILISELNDLDATGFEQTDTHLLAYFEEDNFKSYDVNVLLKEYTFHLTTLPKQNWNTLWENNFKPVVVDDFCVVRADFHQPIKTVQYEIIITPKMSFGTGHHATTYMMIQQMKDIDFTDKKVFDFGTGTGILAVLAKKLGASSVTAIDVDEWSIKNAEENFERNKVKGVRLYQSSELPEEQFSVVLANINRNVLVQYASVLVDLLLLDGVLLLSGLLKEDKEFIVKVFNKLKLIRSEQKQNWVSLLFVR